MTKFLKFYVNLLYNYTYNEDRSSNKNHLNASYGEKYCINSIENLLISYFFLRLTYINNLYAWPKNNYSRK